MKKRVPSERSPRLCAGPQRRRSASRNANNPTPKRVYTAVSDNGGMRAGELTAIRRGPPATLSLHPGLHSGTGTLTVLTDSKAAKELLERSRADEALAGRTPTRSTNAAASSAALGASTSASNGPAARTVTR
jgi:hypothetical protein